jgi:hypothetical protein
MSSIFFGSLRIYCLLSFELWSVLCRSVFWIFRMITSQSTHLWVWIW